MPTTGKAMIITIQAIREAGSRCGRKFTRAITARWTRKSRSAPSVEKNEYSVMPRAVLYQSGAPLTLVPSLSRCLAPPRPTSACSCSAGPVQTQQTTGGRAEFNSTAGPSSGKDLIEILMLTLVVPGHERRGWQQIRHFRPMISWSLLMSEPTPLRFLCYLLFDLFKTLVWR